MKATVGKRLLSLEQVVNQQELRRPRPRDFSAITDDELDYLEWISENVADHGPGWIEATLSPEELANLDQIVGRID